MNFFEKIGTANSCPTKLATLGKSIIERTKHDILLLFLGSFSGFGVEKLSCPCAALQFYPSVNTFKGLEKLLCQRNGMELK